MTHQERTRIALRIDDRAPFADGDAFGSVGPYERLRGRVAFSAAPDGELASLITDFGSATRDDEGRVAFATDFTILKPVDVSRGNRALLFDFANRGYKRTLGMFNNARDRVADPRTREHAGSGFLMRRGYTLVWAGWQGDLLPGDGRLITDVPVAREPDGRPINGRVRAEFLTDVPGVTCFPLSGNGTVRSYPTASMDPANATLTRRQYPWSEPQPLASGDWAFARLEASVNNPASISDSQAAVIPADTHIHLPSGFRPGWIHELTYLARDPLVLGLGMVAVRDFVSFLRYAHGDDADSANPMTEAGPGIERAYCFGRSQAGRVTRDFIFRGFNADASGRRVFDAAWTHVAGGGQIALNHRWARPVRLASFQHEEHAIYSDRYPFTYSPSTDGRTGRRDAILQRPATDPLVLHTDTSTEFWQRRASLVQTDPDGHDIVHPDSVRTYLWASSCHRPDPFGGGLRHTIGQHADNDVVQSAPLFRALLDALDRWASGGPPPPPSRIPTRATGTLVSFADWQSRFPRIPGSVIPTGPNTLAVQDYGERADDGYITIDPPIEGRDQYPVLVPSVDSDGNEEAGIRLPIVQVPLGTATGWNVRGRGLGAGAMAKYLGSFIPFSVTADERRATNDPRPSIQERYPTKAAFLSRIRAAAEALAADGFLLLDEDLDGILSDADLVWSHLVGPILPTEAP